MNFLHRVQGIAVLDEMGNRIFTKYYVGDDTPESFRVLKSIEKQRQLESTVFQAVCDPKRSSSFSGDGDIMLIDRHSALFNVCHEVTIVVFGDSEENELVLFSVLRTLVESLKLALATPEITTRLLLERYDVLLLTVDEMLDEGIILESNPGSIVTEVVPFISVTSEEVARKALSMVNKYLRENL